MNSRKGFVTMLATLVMIAVVMFQTASPAIVAGNTSDPANQGDLANQDNSQSFNAIWKAINKITNKITDLQHQIENIKLKGKPGPQGPPGPPGPPGTPGTPGLPASGHTGGSQPHENMQPYLAISYCIALDGIFPTQGGIGATQPYIGQIIMFAGNFCPSGWAMANGQLLPINQNDALFTLLGTTYGGNGITTFALPDLRGRAPIEIGQGSGLTNRMLGDKGGEESVVLTIDQMPNHNHSTGP